MEASGNPRAVGATSSQVARHPTEPLPPLLSRSRTAPGAPLRAGPTAGAPGWALQRIAAGPVTQPPAQPPNNQPPPPFNTSSSSFHRVSPTARSGSSNKRCDAMHAARPLTDPLQVRRQGFSLLLLRWQQPNTLDDVPIPVLGWPPLHLGSWRRATSSSPRGKRKNGGGRGPSFVSPRLFASLSLFSLAIVRQAASPTWCPNAVTTINSPPVPRISTTTSLSLTLSPSPQGPLHTYKKICNFSFFPLEPRNKSPETQRNHPTMQQVARFLVLAPLVLALVSFVLTSLTLFAGQKKGFMEDYAVVRLNTSMVGHNILSKSDKPSDGGESNDGILGGVKGWFDDKKDSAKDKINNITGNAADKLADKLGISEWYSLHIMDSCEGSYSPGPTAEDVSLTVTNCTSASPAHRLNLTGMLDHGLSVGPLKLNLADINWPDSVQDKLDVLNDALLGLFVLYALAMGFSGLAMFTNAAAFLLPGRPPVVLANLVLGALGGLSCLIGSIIVSVAGSKGVREINDKGARIGLSAERGIKFYILTWISTGFMLGVAVFWLAQFMALRRKKKADAMRSEKAVE
ncbi:SUR7 protein [Purpureocillium lilacinum]|uniref:SUR7 protein n=1 Tax=Purpureocillium lilacinum TaxID=33203 RepID=A0A2U3E7I6_PURLI|nr:SUR7 protein [Purpureocillium lilacinum]